MLTMVLTRHGATPRSHPEQHLGQGIDIGLSDEGRAAARALAARLEGVSFDRIVASPLRRAQETAALLAGGRPIESDARIAEMDYGEWEGLTYEQIEARDAAFRERWVADPGTLACPGGESGEDVATRVRLFLEDAVAAGAVTSSRAGSSAMRPTADIRDAADAQRSPEPPNVGSESAYGPSDPKSARERRSTPAYRDSAPSQNRILVVAHATLNRILLCVVLGVPVRDYRRRFSQDPANLTVLRFGSEPGDDPTRGLLIVGNDTAHVGRPIDTVVGRDGG